MVAITAAPLSLGGLEQHVIYIDTEGAFSAARLTEILRVRFQALNTQPSLLLETMRRVHVHVESTCATLLQRLEALEALIIEHKVRLVVVDSVASVVRKEFEPESSISRTDLLAKEAVLLKHMADTLDLAVVICNQVTTVFNTGEEDGFVTAALGNTWAHSVNTRLVVDFADDKLRRIRICKSPVAPCLTAAFTITTAGIEAAALGACPVAAAGTADHVYVPQAQLALVPRSGLHQLDAQSQHLHLLQRAG